MDTYRTVRWAKRTMLLGHWLLVGGGVFLLVLAIATGEYTDAAVVGWGCGAGTTIYASAQRAIAALESLDATKM